MRDSGNINWNQCDVFCSGDDTGFHFSFLLYLVEQGKMVSLSTAFTRVFFIFILSLHDISLGNTAVFIETTDLTYNNQQY